MESLVAVSPQNFTSFGELLRFLRERVELSQKELALQVGYHYSYMSRIEKNQRTPDPTTLMARFVPALSLDGEPEWTARLLELAISESRAPSASTSLAQSKLASRPPPTALPIFDLSSSNLPIILTPLLGRDEEVLGLTDLLSRHNVRLVTVIGPPGVGKTRLAAHIAAQIAGSFAHGPLFVDLSPVADTDSFLPTLAEKVGIRETSDVPLLKSISTALRHRNILLILDNFEHIIDVAPCIPPLLVGAPGLKILVTSREALHISGEHEFPLTPLPLPESAADAKPLSLHDEDVLENVSHFASVQLFVQRAQSAQPAFKMTNENVAAVVDICRHLDGLPLAIELAAARIKTLNPQAMLQQLDRRLDWLTRGSRDANISQPTLRGTMEWSYNLLSEPEQILLRRLSVFSGGWTLRAAESICADRIDPVRDPLLRREDILDTLIKLVDKSLVVTDASVRQNRFHLLETMREFGREKLTQTGELTEILNRHLEHFTEYAEESESHLDGDEQAKWIEISGKEHNNFRSAMDYSLTPGANVLLGLRIGAAISLFWIEHSHFHEGIERLQTLLKHAVEPQHQRAKAKILYRAAAIHFRLFSYNTAYKLCQQSIEISRALDDQRSLASGLFYMGDVYIGIQDHTQAKSVLEESVSICWAIHFPQQLNMALTSLGRVLHEQGEHERALAMAKEALAIAEQLDDTWGIIHALQSLGAIGRFDAKYDTAIDYFERSLPLIRLIRDRLAEGITLANLSILYNLKENYPASGHAAEQSFALFQSIGDEVQQPFPLRMMGYSAIHAGNMIRARALILESLKGNRWQEHIPGQLACLVALGTCELEDGNVTKAVTFAGFVENQLRTEAFSLMEPDALALSRLLNAGREKLKSRVFEQMLLEGRSLRLDDILSQELASAN